MDSKMIEALAVEAGYWIHKDHGKWFVGRDGHGIIESASRGFDAFGRITDGHNSKARARAAMIAAFRERL